MDLYTTLKSHWSPVAWESIAVDLTLEVSAVRVDYPQGYLTITEMRNDCDNGFVGRAYVYSREGDLNCVRVEGVDPLKVYYDTVETLVSWVNGIVDIARGAQQNAYPKLYQPSEHTHAVPLLEAQTALTAAQGKFDMAVAEAAKQKGELSR